MSMFDQIIEERSLRSGAVAVSCKKPVSCGDRIRSPKRPTSPTDKHKITATRIGDLAASLKSALLCRELSDIERYMGLLNKALADIKADVSSKDAKRAFDAEAAIKCPKAEAADFPTKWTKTMPLSNRTGVGTAPAEAPEDALKIVLDTKRAKLKTVRQR